MRSCLSYCQIMKVQRACKNLNAFARINGLFQAFITKFQIAGVNSLFNLLVIFELTEIHCTGRIGQTIRYFLNLD